MTNTAAASDTQTCILCDHPAEKHRPACTELVKRYDGSHTPFRNRRYSPEYEKYMAEKKAKIVTKVQWQDTALRFERCPCDGLPDLTAAAAATARDGNLCNSCGHPEEEHLPGESYGPPRWCRATTDLLGHQFQAGVHCGSCKGYWPKRETPALLRNPNDLPVR